MSLPQFQCSVCLEITNSTTSIDESDDNNIKWSFKLKNIAPELEWIEFYTICAKCKFQLENAYDFKSKCLAMAPQRKELKLEEKKEENLDDYDIQENASNEPYSNDSSDTDESKFDANSPKRKSGFVCYHCEKSYVSKVTLAQHIRLKHDTLNTYTKICSECKNCYINQTVLEDHMRKSHGIGTTELTRRSKEYECLKCGKLYTREKVMKNHLLSCDGRRRHPKKGITDFRCEKCDKYYTTEKILRAHTKLCQNEEKPDSKAEVVPYNCRFCTATFVVNDQFKLHLKNEHNMNFYFCKACKKVCVTLDEYKQHLSGDHPFEEQQQKWKPVKRKGRQSHRHFSCEICNAVFFYVKVLVEHCVKEHAMDAKSVKAYSCEQCDNRFSSSANMIQHKKYHEGTRTHICSFCGKSFITKSDLTSHEYTHYNRRNYKCDSCDKAFNTNKNLRTHKLVVHTEPNLWKYGCVYCQKRFPMKTGFNQHMKRHAGDKQFSCHICEKSFISKSEMQKHMRFHSNIRAYKCDHCGKEYKDRKVFEVHLARVHGIGDAKVPVRVKKFVCHICPNTFYDRQKLARHLCTHSGLKPYECTACDKKFTDKSYLKHHLKVAHNVLEVLKY